MTTDEVELLAELATALNLNFAQVVSSMAFFGAYAVLCGLALCTIITRQTRNFLSWTLFSALLLTFLIVTTDISVMTSYTFNQLRASLLDNRSLPLAERMLVFKTRKTSQAAVAMNLIFGGGADCGLVFLINDALVAWRALAFWPPGTSSARAFRWTFFVLLFSSFATWVVFVAMYFRGPSVSYNNSEIQAILEVVSYALGIAVNLASTAIIGYMTWSYASQLKGALRIPSFQILILLTESGLLYGIIQVIRLALALACGPNTSLNGPLAMVANVWQICGLVVTATYTPAIILIVNYGCSLKETIVHTHHHQPTTNEPETFQDKRYPDCACRQPPSSELPPAFSRISFSPNANMYPSGSTFSRGSSDIVPIQRGSIC